MGSTSAFYRALFPQMRLIIKDDADAVASWVAAYVAARINDFKPTPDRPFVLGLPTGSSPLQTYKKVRSLPSPTLCARFGQCSGTCSAIKQLVWMKITLFLRVVDRDSQARRPVLRKRRHIQVSR